MLVHAWRNLSTRRYVFLLTALTVLIELVMLNRFPFTSEGVSSFGRVWMFYLSYDEVGFVRRALFGTILSLTDVASLFRNEYVFAITVHHVLILVLTWIVVRFVLQQGIRDKLLLASIMLSPVFLIQSAYSTGTLDMPIFILALLNMLYVRHVGIFTVLLVLGIFVHELFVFTIPAQFLALIIRTENKLGDWQTYKRLLLPAAIAAAAIFAVMAYGKLAMPQAEYELLMQSKLPHAAHQHDLWSGYFEVSTGLAKNALYTQHMTHPLRETLPYMAVPLLYMVLVLARAVMIAHGRILKALVILVSALPLLACFLGMDFYRWISLTDNLALAFTLLLTGRHPNVAPRWLHAMLLVFILFGPFAPIMIDQPFPIYWFLMKVLQ